MLAVRFSVAGEEVRWAVRSCGDNAGCNHDGGYRERYRVEVGTRMDGCVVVQEMV